VEVLAHGPRRARQRLGFADDRGFRLFRVLALGVLLKALSFPPFLAEGLRCVPISLQRGIQRDRIQRTGQLSECSAPVHEPQLRVRPQPLPGRARPALVRAFHDRLPVLAGFLLQNPQGQEKEKAARLQPAGIGRTQRGSITMLGIHSPCRVSSLTL
jgi:hypothetical protein